MAQPIPCDLHDDPVRANYLIQDLDTGETIGICALHAKPWGDVIQERIEELYVQADAQEPEPEPEPDLVPEPVADTDGGLGAQDAPEEPDSAPVEATTDTDMDDAQPQF